MIALESFLLTLLILTLGYCSYTDIKEGIIKNKAILFSLIIGGLISLVYYFVFARADAPLFFTNLIIMTIISLIMYKTNLWAAGDSKLLFLILVLIPARFYRTGSNLSLVPSIYILVLTFIIAFIFIVIQSIVLRIKNNDRIYMKFQINNLKAIALNYLYCLIYVIGVNYFLILIVPDFVAKNGPLVSVLNLFLMIFIYKYEVFKSMKLIIPVSFLSITELIIFYTRHLLISFDYHIYFYLMIILFLRSISEDYNYQVIPTQEVKKGMIISFKTITQFLPSRVKGLPQVTTEDMRTRITEAEAESIKRWEKSKYGSSEITIIRKIPFAIFLSLGTILFLIFRMGIIS